MTSLRSVPQLGIGPQSPASILTTKDGERAKGDVAAPWQMH